MLGDAILSTITRDGKIYDLGQPLYNGMPVSNFHPPYIFTLMVRHGDAVQPEGCGASNEVVVISGHTGTHLDALGHIADDGRIFGGADATQAQVGAKGLREHGIEQVAPIV